MVRSSVEIFLFVRPSSVFLKASSPASLGNSIQLLNKIIRVLYNTNLPSWPIYAHYPNSQNLCSSTTVWHYSPTWNFKQVLVNLGKQIKLTQVDGPFETNRKILQFFFCGYPFILMFLNNILLVSARFFNIFSIIYSNILVWNLHLKYWKQKGLLIHG